MRPAKQPITDSFASEVVGQFVKELECVEVVFPCGVVSALDTDSQVLSHVSGLDRLNADSFKGLGEPLELVVLVQFGTVEETTGPREDGSC